MGESSILPAHDAYKNLIFGYLADGARLHDLHVKRGDYMIVGLVLVLVGFVMLFIVPIPGVVLVMLGGMLILIGVVFK